MNFEMNKTSTGNETECPTNSQATNVIYSLKAASCRDSKLKPIIKTILLAIDITMLKTCPFGMGCSRSLSGMSQIPYPVGRVIIISKNHPMCRPGARQSMSARVLTYPYTRANTCLMYLGYIGISVKHVFITFYAPCPTITNYAK